MSAASKEARRMTHEEKVWTVEELVNFFASPFGAVKEVGPREWALMARVALDKSDRRRYSEGLVDAVADIELAEDEALRKEIIAYARDPERASGPLADLIRAMAVREPIVYRLLAGNVLGRLRQACGLDSQPS